MSTLFGEGSLVKKIITWVSAIIIVLPIVAYSTVEVAEAAIYDNIGKYENVDPSVPLKTSTRNPNKIVGLSMTEKKGVPIMRMNISASSDDVIKKGDQLDIKFSKKNVDTNKIKQLAAKDNNSLYNISKKGNDLVVNFKKDATSGNYQEVFAIATKNVKAHTKATASFAGKDIKIDNNNINSQYRAPQKQQTNQPQKVVNQNNNQQSTNNQQQSSTQAASSNDGESQATTSTGQTSQQQAAQQQQTQQVQQNQTVQNGGTTQQQANQTTTDGQQISPSFSQAEDAVNQRTTISVTGTATSDPTQKDLQATSSNVAQSETQTSSNTETPETQTTTSTPAATTQTQSNAATQATPQQTTPVVNTNTAATTQTTTAPVQTQTTQVAQPTQQTTTTQPVVQNQTTTFEPQQVSSTTSSTEASDNSGYTEIANSGYVSPKTTLDNYLTSDQDLDNNQVQNSEDTYEDNSQYEAIKQHVQQKAQGATQEEIYEITKDLPSIWHYIGTNDTDSDTEGQVWNFHSTLSTGRDLAVTIDGTAQPDSTDPLQQQMPELLRAMGKDIEPGALDEAVDIDALKNSQIYQDYLDGKYTGPNGENSASTSDAVNTVLNHTKISLDKPDNGAAITQLPDVAKVDPNMLLNRAKENAQNGSTTQTTADADSQQSQAVYSSIKQDTYNKMTPWASDDEKAEMLKSVPYIWNDASSKTNKDDKVGQLYNYVLNGTDGRQIYYTIDGRVIPNGNKYEKQFPNVIVSLGQNMTKGQFDPIVNNDILKNSKAYQDYTSKQNSQGNAATTAATTAATAAPAAGGLGIAPLLLGGLLPVVGLPLLLGGLALAPIATGAVLATAPIALALAQPVILPALALIPAITLGIPAITLGLPLTLGLKLAFAPIDLLNTFVVSKLASIVLTAPITIFNTIAGVTLGLINTVIGSIPLALFDFIAPVVLNFVIVHVISRLVQLTLFNTLLFTTLAKALINGAIDLALALSFIGLPIALIKGLFDLFRLGLGLFNAFAIPMLVKGLTFLALAPLALLNTIGLTLFNISIPMLLGFITSLFLSNLVGGLTFLTLLGLKLIKDLLKNGFQLLIRLAAVATILVGLPVLIVAAQILNFFILLVANAVGGLLLWGLLTLAKSLMLAGLGIALFSLPLLGQFAINTLVKWSIRALIHIFRFFVGLFKVGARLVLSFVLGLLNAIAGIAKAASVITAVVSGIAAALTALIPVVGPVLALLPLLISLLSIANSLILTPIKLLLGFLNLVVLGLNLLAIPVYLFIRPLISIALALGAGLLSDILMPLITLPLVLFNQLTLFNLIGLPLLLLNLLGTFLVEPLVLAGLGLLNALALPFLLALAALNLVALLGLVLLSFRLPLIALVLLALPSLIPFFNLIMDTIFLAPLVTLLLSVLNLFIGLPLMMLIDSIINLVVPFLVWLAGMILLAPIFGPLAFLNPLTWINLPLISIIGTFLTKLALKLISLPIIFLVNGLLSLIPAAVAAFVVGLLRALFGGLPFLLLAPLFLLPIILNGLLTALVPGLNLFTVPAALVALFLGLPLALLGLLNNLLGKAILRVLSFVLTYLASNVLKDLLALVGVPLVINLLTPLIFLTKLLTTQFGIFPALWLGLPLLAQLATKALLWGLTFIKGFAHVALDLLNIGATLLTLPLWTILPALNLLRRLALGFVALVSLPLRLLKDVFDIIRAIVEIGAILALPLLVGIPAFLLLLPLTTLNFLGMKLLNMAIPFVLSLLATLGASLIVNLLTFIGMLALHLFNKLLKLGAKLLLLGAITLLILGALPILIGAAVLNFFLLAALNLFIGFNAWLITTLFNNLLVGALLLGLLLLPLVSQLIINTVVKWTIRAVVHLIRFFVGLFRLGARLVLQFIIGLTNLVLGVTKAISVVAAVTNLLLAPISLLVPVVGPVLFLLHLLRAGLAGINFLILLPLKLLAGLLNLLTLGGLLLSIPYWLFIRPLTSVLLAIGAGILSDIVMTLLTLPLVLFNTLTLFNLIGIPALLLKAFNNLVVLPLLLAGIGLILAVGLPLALLLGALGLLGTLALGLLGLGFPLIALILLSLPNLIPFLDLILAALNLLGLFSLISSPAKLLLLPFKILLDLFNDFVLPLLVGGLTFLLLLPLLGIITFLNPLRWLNLGILSAIGTFLTKLLLGLLAIPFILVKNLLTSLIPAVLAGVLVGLLRALFGGLPFLLLALGLLLPLILNGLLTALIPGLNLLTVPLGLLALLLGLPLVALGILNNLLKQLVWTVLGTILTYLAFNLAKDLLDLLLWLPLQLLLALPLFLLNLALNAFILRPLLLFGLPLLAALLTNLALVAFNLIRRGLELLAELLTLGATLLLSPLTLGLPLLNLLRRILKFFVTLRLLHNLLHQILDGLLFVILPFFNILLFGLFSWIPGLIALIGTVLLEHLPDLLIGALIGLLLLIPALLIEGLIAGVINFLLSLLPALLGGLLKGLITLFFNGLPVFLFIQLLVLLPLILGGLLTALIPGLNLLTIPLGLLALLALPLTILGVINNVIQSLLQGLLAGLLTQLLFNVIADLSLLGIPLLFLLSPILLVLGAIALLVLSFLAIIIPAIILSLLFLPIIGLAMLALAPILLPIFLPLILLGLLLFIPFLIFGILSSAILVWFFAPILLQLAVNPIADFVTFILMTWMMFEQPVLFWFFGFINTPVFILSFIGMFVNWLNPLNLLFHIIGIGALIGLPLTLIADFLVLSFIKWSSLLTINFAAGWLAFLTLGLAQLGLFNLNLLYILNTFIVTLPMIAYVWIVLVIAAVVMIATVVVTLGINPVAIFEIWVMVPLFTTGAILLALFTMVIGLTLDVIMTFIKIPFIVGNLQFGLLMAALANPLAALIGINLLATLGVTSIVLLLAGLFMLGWIWLPVTFSPLSFLLYFIMGSPLWMTLNFAGLVPVIGWIVQLIVDILWMLIGLWGTALVTDNTFALFVHIFIPLAFSAVTGIMLLLGVLPVLLLVLPLALIQSLLLLGLLFGGVALLSLVVVIPAVIFGVLATATMIWFFAPIFLQILVNPIADFVTFTLLLWMMFEQPILFWWAFQFITVPLMLFSFVGMFLNWLNPLNYIFKALAALPILGIPVVVALALLTLNILRFASLLTINLFAGFPAFIVLTIAKWLMIGLGVLFFLNTFVVTLPMIAYVWLVIVIAALSMFVIAFATLGINVPAIFAIWVMVPFFTIFAILIALTTIPIMLALDLFDVLIALVPIVGNLQLGLLLDLLANPLITILAQNIFAILGLTAIVLFVASLFMLAHVWLPFTFGINSFLLYFVMGNPLWMLLQFAGLVPVIGWVVQLIVDILWMLIGLWGTALITDNNFALFMHIFVTLAFAAIPVMMLLLAVLPVILLVLPVGIIGSLILLALINLPIFLFNLVLALPVIIFGVFSVGTLIWFLAPLLLQLAVNPIADFVAFQLLLFWAIENPVFFYVFRILTVPLMFFTFTGTFVNWFNPLNWLFHALNAFTLLGIPVLALLGVLTLDILRFASLLTINLFAGFPAFIILTIAKWLMIGLVGLYFLNTFIVTLPMIAYVWLCLVLGFIVVFVSAFATLGINVPNIFSIWVMVPLFTIGAILIALTTIPIMLSVDLVITLLAIAPIVGSLQLGLILATLANPLAGLLAINAFGILGLTSLIMFALGFFMQADTWLPVTFNIIPFLLYFILGGPLLYSAHMIGLIPVIGWIVQIIVDIAWMLIGLWGTALVTDNFFAIFVHLFVPLAFATIPGIMMLLAILPVGLLVLPVAIIGSLILMALINLPVLLFNLLIAIPVLLFGLFSAATIVWFLAPVVLQLMVNPIADLVTFIIMVFTAAEQPLFYIIFSWQTIPLTIGSFMGMLINWLNPLNILFHALAIFTILAIPITDLGVLLAIDGLRLLDLIGIFTIIGAPAGFLGLLPLTIAKWLMVGLVGLYFLNTFIVTLPMIAYVWLCLLAGAILVFLNAFANLGINVPNIFSMWIMVPFFSIGAVVLALTVIPLMLAVDTAVSILAIAPIVGNLQLGLIMSALLNPIAGLIAANLFGILGLSSVALFFLGLFMLADVWLPLTFGLDSFILYFLLANPVWYMLHMAGLVPVVGWVVQIIVDLIWMLAGLWGTALITDNNFALFVHIFVTLAFSVIPGMMLLLAVAPVLLLLLPVAIIGTLIFFGLINLPLLLIGIPIVLLTLIIGIAGALMMFWFFTPIFTYYMINPIADFIAFIELFYTAFQNPVLFWMFKIFTVPALIFSFIGMFTNWLNPINWLFIGISLFSLVAPIITTLFSLAMLNLLRLGSLVLPFGFNFVAALVAFAALTAAKWLLGFIFLNLAFVIPALVLKIPLLILVGLVIIVIAFLVVFINAFATVGINVPNVFVLWLSVDVYATWAVLFGVLHFTALIAIDLALILFNLPIVGLLLGVGLIAAGLAHPLMILPILIAQLAIGLVSIGSFLSGIFMFAALWVPLTNNLLAFAVFLIFANPIFMMLQWMGLVPVIGWVVQLIFDWTYMPIAFWFSGLLTALGFTFNVMTIVWPIFVANMFGISLLTPILGFLLPLLLPLIPLVLSIALGMMTLANTLIAMAFVPFLVSQLLLPILNLLIALLPLLPLIPLLPLLLLPLLLLAAPLLLGLGLLRRLLNFGISLLVAIPATLISNLLGQMIPNLLRLLAFGLLLGLNIFNFVMNLIPGLLHKLVTLPLWILSLALLLPYLLALPLILLDMFNSFVISALLNLLKTIGLLILNNFVLNLLNLLFIKLPMLLLLAIPNLILGTLLAALAFPLIKLALPIINALLVSIISSPLLALPLQLFGLFNQFLRGLGVIIDLGLLLLLGLPGLLPFHNLLMDALFLLPLLLNLVALFNLLRTPLKWLLDIFNQLALPLLVQFLTFLALIPFFGLISLLNPFKWLRMALLAGLATIAVQIISTLILLPLKLLNNKILSLLPALLNGLLLGFLRNILGGLPLDLLGLLALPLLNILGLIGALTPGLRLLGLPLLLLTQLLLLPLLLDNLRNLIAPLLWGLLAGLLTYPIANLLKNILDIALLPLLGLLATLPIFLLKLFNKAFVLRPLLLFGLPLLAGLLAVPLVAIFNLLRRLVKFGLNLLNGALALLTMPIWLGLPALNLLRRALILPALLLTLLRGLRNILGLLGFPLLLLAAPLLAGLATFLLGLPLITLLNMLLSMPLLALLLPLLAALPILPIKILLDLLLLPLVLLGNKLLGLPAALLAGLLLPLLLGGLFRHLLKLPFDLLKLLGLGLFNLLLPFIPLLNLLTPLLWPLGLFLLPLALADVIRDLLGNLPFDLLNLFLLPLITAIAGLGLLVPGLGLLLAPILLPLILFNLLAAMPLALIRTIGDIAKALLLGLPLALLGALLALPVVNLINDALSLLLLPLLSGLLTLPLFLLNLGLLTLLAFPLAKGLLPFLIANGLSALVANFLPVLIGLLLNPVIVLANLFRLLKDLIKTVNRFILLGLLLLPGLIPFHNLLLNALFLIPALINGLSLLNLLTLPLKFLKDLIKNTVLPLLAALLTNLLLLPIFGPLQFLNPINWILVPAIALLRTFVTKLLAKLILVPGLVLLNLLTSLIPATLAALVVPFLRGLLGGLPLDILGLLGLPLLNLLALVGTLIPGVRLLALPLLLLTQLLGLPLLLDTLRNLVAPLLWGALAGLLTFPIANLVKDALALLGLPLLDLLTFLPIFLLKMLKNVLLGNLLAIGLPLLAQALTFFGLVALNLLRAGLKLLRNLIPLALTLLTMPLWFNLPLLNIIRRVAFWALLGLELLTLPFKLLRDLLRLVGLPLLMLGLPLLAGLINFLLILPLVTLATMLLALPLPLTLLLPLLALLGTLPIKLLADLLLLPLMLLANALLALPLALLLGVLIPLVLGGLNGLIKLPLDLLGLAGLPLLLGLLDLGKLFALLNPLLWPLLPIINVLRNILRMMIPFKLADILKDILGPLSALPIDGLLALAIPALGLLTVLTMLNPLFWPLLPVLLPLALTLGLVGTPIALLRVLKDLAKLALPVLIALLLFPIIHTGLNILGLLALPLISGLLTLPLFLLNLGLKTLITLPITKAVLPILINLGIVLVLAGIPALIILPIVVLRNLVKGLRLIGDALAALLALPGVLKDLFDLVILPLKILIKPLLVLGLPLLAKVLTFLALTPLMLLNNLLAHLITLPIVALLGLGNSLLPLLVPFVLNMLVRPLSALGLMLLNGVILPALLKLAIAIPLVGLLVLPFVIGLLTLPLFLLSLPFPLFNMGLQLLSLGMIIPGLAMILGGLILLPVGLMGLGGSLTIPGTTIPGTGTTPGDTGNVVPEPGYGIRQIPSVGFWVHNDPLVL